MKVAVYTRVSTTDQNDEMQLRELNEYSVRQGWEVSATYQDVMSGAKSNRPGLAQLMADARMKRFDVLLCWKLDRFGRSLVDCLNNIQELERCGIQFIAVTQGLDTDQRNPASRFLLHVLGAAAEFERALNKKATRRCRCCPQTRRVPILWKARAVLTPQPGCLRRLHPLERRNHRHPRFRKRIQRLD
jgi:DNA invertase Pin-like site-specific DNA recombinase